jgi:isopenicillin N synthase-like dioxygenase
MYSILLYEGRVVFPQKKKKTWTCLTIFFLGIFVQLVSNNEYHSVGHRVMIKSSQDARASLAVFFNPAMSGGDSNLLGPLPELFTTGKPAMYRSFTMTEFMDSRRKFGHGKLSTDQFKVALE